MGFCTAIIGNAQANFNSVCQNATLLTRDTIIFDTLGFSALSESFNCNYQTKQKVRAKWYKYKGDGNLITFSMVNKILYTNQLFIFEGSCDSLICKILDSSEPGKFLTEKDVDYYFVIQKPILQDINDAPFTINFSSSSLKNYATCTFAPILNCGDSLTFDFEKDLIPSHLPNCQSSGATGYFRINGDGNKRIFNFSGPSLNGYYLLFTEKDDCNNMVCTGIRYLEPSMAFSTQLGKSYILLLVKYVDYVNSLINLKITCDPDVESSTCLTAIDIECNKNYNIDNIPNAVPEIGPNGYASIWYKFEGDDSRKILNFKPSPNQNSAYVKVYNSNVGCSDLNVLGEATNIIFDSDMVINSLVGKVYYVQIFHERNEPFSFSVKCNSISDRHIDCSSALDLACVTTYQLYQNAKGYNEQCNTDQLGGHWFKVHGDDKVYELSLQIKDDENVRMSIFNGDCDSLSCVLDYRFSRYDLFKNKIVLKAPVGETYFIRFMYDYRFNTAELISTCRAEKGIFNPVCAEADTLICGNFVNPSNRVYGIDLNDSCQKYFGIWYKVKGNGNIINIPSFVYYSTEYSIYKGDCDQLTCINTNIFAPEGLKLFIPKDSTYIIKISVPYNDVSFPNQMVKCQTAPENVKCQNAEALNCDTQELILNFKNSALDLSSQVPCSQNLPGFWYLLEGNGQVFNFKSTNDRVLYITSFTGNCDSLICGERAVNRLKINTMQGQKYYIYFSSLLSELEIIKITCTEMETNDTIEKAKEIFCDTDFVADFSATAYDTSSIYFPKRTNLWFKFIGQDKAISFTKVDTLPLYLHYEVYVEGLDSSIIRPSNDVLLYYNPDYPYKIEFFGRKDVTYYLRLVTEDNVRHVFRASCRDMSEADICESAIPITCGVKYVYDSKNHTADYFNGQIIENGMWFTFDGNDQYVKINFYQNGSILNYSFYESDNSTCNGLKKIQEVFAKSGKRYYLNIGNLGIYTTVNNIQFELVCKDASHNAGQCIEAKFLECGDVFKTNNYKVQEASFGECSFAKYEYGDWFTFIGDGSTWTFFKKLNGSQIRSPLIYIGKGTCDSLICIQGFGSTTYQSSGEARTSFSFKTENGVQYFMKFASENGEIFEHEYGVECFYESTNYSCSSAQKIACGDRIIGVLNKAIPDSLNVCNDQRPGLFYELRGDGSDYALELSNKINRDLYVRIMENDCINGRCLYEGSVSTDGNAIVFKTINNRKYIIKISSDDNEAVFSFNTSCLIKGDNIDCNSAEFISCGDSTKVTCYTTLGFEGNIPCQWDRNTAFWYILPKTDSLFNINILSKSSDFFNIELVKGSCNEIQCLGSFSERTKNISFKVNKAEDNYLVFHAPSTVVNELMFNIQCVQPILNQNCRGAIQIGCGDKISHTTSLANFDAVCGYLGKSLWWKFEGNDEKMTFDFTDVEHTMYVWIAEDKSCDSIICSPTKYLSQSGQINFVAEKGKNYFLILQHHSYIGGSFNMEIKCSEAVVNDVCKGAIELSGSTSIDLSNSTGHQFNNLNGCQQETVNGLWYFVPGNDSIQIISMPVVHSNSMYYQLFSGGCDHLTCIESGEIFNARPLKFLSKVGENYYIYFYTSSVWNNGPFIINVSSATQPINDVCGGSAPLICGDSLVLNFNNYTKDGLQFCSGNLASAWYKFSPDETSNLDFVSNFPPKSFIIEIYQNCTTSCLLSSVVSSWSENKISILGLKDSTYYFRIAQLESDTFSLGFQFSCAAPIFENHNYKTAVDLKCKEYNIESDQIPLSINNSCFYTPSRQLWYKFVGDGSNLKLTFDHNDVSYYISDTSCQNVTNLISSNGVFNTELGKEYYFVVWITRPEFKSRFFYKIQYQCIDNIEDAITTNDRLKISPNPFIHKTYIEVYSETSELSNLKIINTVGKVMAEKRISLRPGYNSIEIGEEEVNGNGVFTVLVYSDDRIRSSKMIKLE